MEGVWTRFVDKKENSEKERIETENRQRGKHERPQGKQRKLPENPHKAKREKQPIRNTDKREIDKNDPDLENSSGNFPARKQPSRKNGKNKEKHAPCSHANGQR